MNVKFFIDRPVLSSVLSISIVIAGIIGLFGLPIEQYPNIAPPTIQVTAAYPGASAEAVEKSVVTPLEQAINGVENMMYMTSSSTNSGVGSITIFFRQGTDPDMAAVMVQNRVNTATPLLPAEVNQIGVQTNKRQTSMLQFFSVYSPDGKYDDKFIGNYININLKPEIQRIEGVGDVMVMGPDYSMRFWLKPDVMAQYKLIPSDITYALAEQNIEASTGSFGENSNNMYQYTMKYKGRLETLEEFGEIVIRSLPTGEVLKVKDVATIELGKDSYSFDGGVSGYEGVSAMISQIAGSNATEVNENISAFFNEARKSMPEGLDIMTIMSTNDFLYASIHEVIITLLIAFVLVIFVVYFFLQDFRSTLIPGVAIIVSLVGTFAFLMIAGFTLNLLTLFALILAIGTVVDDAIIVVEAVQTRFDDGYTSPYKASVDAMKTLVSPIITTSLVFMAVFIPVSFMPGTSGTFYTQFGITMAVAVAISTFNALTLSPALCALFLKPVSEEQLTKKTFANRMRKAYFATYHVTLKKYKNGVLFFLHKKYLAWGLLVACAVALVYLMNTTKTGFVPDEDSGTIFVNINTAPGSGLKHTTEVMNRIEERIKEIPEIENYSEVAGYGLMSGQGVSYGMFIIRLKDWGERKEKSQSSQAVLGQIYARTADIKDATIFALQPGMIPGYGMGNGFELHLQNKQGYKLEEFYKTTQGYLAQLMQRPEVGMAYSTFNISYPQYLVDVDAAKCKRAGLSPKEVLSVLGGYYGSVYASNFNRFTKVYRVYLQADPKYRLDEHSMNDIYVRNGSEMAPLSQFVSLKRVNGPEALSHFNIYPSISAMGQVAPGYSTGDAIKAVQETAEQFLPQGYGYEFGGITREETENENTTIVIFGICLLFVYLILAALYESYMIPFAVLLCIPFGLLGSFFFAKVMDLENNIYLQTGLIMIIGLLAKTAILLTEYASERRRAGMTLSQAAYSAAAARLRPILMTAGTMVFGMLPLMFAHGVGANGNSSLGTGVVGGMLIGTLAMLFVVPTFFIVFQYIQEKIKPIEPNEINDPHILKEIEEINAYYQKRNKKKS